MLGIKYYIIIIIIKPINSNPLKPMSLKIF
jgi:hypothetical protein